MDIVRLDSLDHARSLVECAYDIYGLTFHRGWLYEPEALVELNRSGDVTSLLAIDRGQVVGHLGLMRPSWDVRRGGVPITDPGLREVGLSIVRPDFRGEGVQALLGAAAFSMLAQEGAHGAYMKCVTHHTRSQKGALRFGAAPVALSLGSVPRFIVYDHEATDPAQPISTLGCYVPFRPMAEARAWLPEDYGWLKGAIGRAGVRRTQGPALGVVGETDMEVRWQADRQLGQIYVLHAGADLVERLREKLRWLVGGHIAHVAVYLPTDQPLLADLGPALAELGLFVSGLLPGFFRGERDALVLQAIAFSHLDPNAVQVTGEAATEVRDRVLAGWLETQGRALRLLTDPHRGRVRVEVAKQPREADQDRAAG